MAKSELELEEERRRAENIKANQGKGDEPRGMLSELGHKIKKNPWKTLGTVLLATAFPAGTIIAGAIATGVVAKSGYDAHVNKKASKAEVSTHTTAAPPQHHKQPYSPKIAPISTPNMNKSQVKGKGGGGEHTH